jgi:two-component system chemotaxis sensor kinase CheA
LEPLRQSRITATPELTDVLLRSADALRALNGEVTTGRPSGIEPDELVEELRSCATNGSAANTGRGPWPVPLPRQPMASTGQASIHVFARVAGDSIAPAALAMQVLMALGECGRILTAEPDQATIERGDELYEVQVLVETELGPEAVTQHLAHISELDSLEITPCAEAPEKHTVAGPHFEKDERDTVRGGSATAARNNGAGALKTVRTSVERLDKLMDLVGELVTDRNRLLQTHALLSARYADSEFVGELARGISHLASITDELQEEVMRARMLPLEHAFTKLPRLVRDLAHDAGKNVVLDIQGQETELDRSVIEEIGDPLLHLLRNAVDHGIEPSDERRATGKPEQGTIRLSGRSEGNHIVITVADDGRGIDGDRVRQAAIDRGLVTEEATAHLSDAETLDLIFAPGLSTAKKVTDVSGRGVGMDVVRNNIERLHGSVTVKSQRGRGTTFELRLPLTLAIMPVLQVLLSGYTYCIPLSAVTEVLATDPSSIHRIDRNEVVLWRGRLLPLLRLRTHYGLPDVSSPGERFSTVAVRWGDEYLGLVVDRLLGQQEIVIKNLGHMIGHVPGLSGSAILGDGSVALIIDVPELIKRAGRAT